MLHVRIVPVLISGSMFIGLDLTSTDRAKRSISFGQVLIYRLLRYMSRGWRLVFLSGRYLFTVTFTVYEQRLEARLAHTRARAHTHTHPMPAGLKGKSGEKFKFHSAVHLPAVPLIALSFVCCIRSAFDWGTVCRRFFGLDI